MLDEFDLIEVLQKRVKRLEEGINDAIDLIAAITYEYGGTIRISERALEASRGIDLERTDDPEKGEIIFRLKGIQTQDEQNGEAGASEAQYARPSES